MKPEYKIFYSEEDNGYIATTTEFQSLSGYGNSAFVAFAELIYAVQEAKITLMEKL